MTCTLSKTDFANFLTCPEAFWLKKRKPDAYPGGGINDHAALLAQQGYEFEKVALDLLQVRLGEGFTTQMTLEAPRGLLSRADGVFVHPDGALDIYEVKSGTGASDYIGDLAFQLAVAGRGGHTVTGVRVEWSLGSELNCCEWSLGSELNCCVLGASPPYGPASSLGSELICCVLGASPPFMARQERIQFPGASYHLMARGNAGGDIFVDDEDRRMFLSLLGDLAALGRWRLHA